MRGGSGDEHDTTRVDEKRGTYFLWQRPTVINAQRKGVEEGGFTTSNSVGKGTKKKVNWAMLAGPRQKC